MAVVTGHMGRDPFNQNFRSKTEWIGSVQLEKFRKKGSTFRGGPLLSVGPVRSKWTVPFDVIYQTRATVFRRDIQTPRRELKIRRAAEYF